jgi:hypothetical protein
MQLMQPLKAMQPMQHMKPMQPRKHMQCRPVQRNADQHKQMLSLRIILSSTIGLIGLVGLI